MCVGGTGDAIKAVEDVPDYEGQDALIKLEQTHKRLRKQTDHVEQKIAELRREAAKEGKIMAEIGVALEGLVDLPFGIECLAQRLVKEKFDEGMLKRVDRRMIRELFPELPFATAESVAFCLAHHFENIPK